MSAATAEELDLISEWAESRGVLRGVEFVLTCLAAPDEIRALFAAKLDAIRMQNEAACIGLRRVGISFPSMDEVP